MRVLQLFFLVLLLSTRPAWAEDCDDFGTGISLLPVQKVMDGGASANDFHGDYNGDGILDRVVFLRLIDRPEFSKDVTTVVNINPALDPLYPKDGSVAIGIILAGGKGESCKKYVLYDDSLLHVRMNKNPEGFPFFVKRVKRRDPTFYFWKNQIKELKYDAMQLGVLDMDMLIYWNGKTFEVRGDKLYEP
jgi:hypothetical protein